METIVLADKTLREISEQIPLLAGVLSKHGLDFCCGGGNTLKDACSTAGINLAEVLAELESVAGRGKAANTADALETPGLIRHILDNHHAYLYEALPVVEQFALKVASVHGDAHPELIEIRNFCAQLKAELDQHLIKEEQILFPLILDMHDKVQNKQPMQNMHCGSVNNPIRVMNYEHDSATDMLAKIRKLSKDYSLPEGACNSYRFLFEKLKELEADVTEHMRIETENLFVRAENLERQLAP